MPQLQSIDEVVEVPEPLKEEVSITVEELMSEARWEMEKEEQICVNIEMYDEVQREQELMRRMSTSGCGYHRMGWNPAVQSVLMMLQQTKSGPYVEEQQVLDQATEESPIGARMRCTTATRWVAGKTLETENATKGEHPEECCTSSNTCKATWQVIGA